MRTARVILWRACNRDCELCCNKAEAGAIQGAIPIKSICDVTGYDEVLLTGGEPMLNPDKVIGAATYARKFNPHAKIYLYTAWWYNDYDRMLEVLRAVDGVHYAVHGPSMYDNDFDMLKWVQDHLFRNKDWDKSYRLHLDRDIASTVEITPCLWSRIDCKPWLVDCPLPPHEDLFEIITE